MRDMHASFHASHASAPPCSRAQRVCRAFDVIEHAKLNLLEGATPTKSSADRPVSPRASCTMGIAPLQFYPEVATPRGRMAAPSRRPAEVRSWAPWLELVRRCLPRFEAPLPPPCQGADSEHLGKIWRNMATRDKILRNVAFGRGQDKRGRRRSAAI